MSTLTKLFVVVLVVCSLLMTAALVVFVNQAEDKAEATRQAEQQYQRATTDNQLLRDQLQAAITREAAQVAEANRRVETARAAQTDLTGQLTRLQNELNQVQAEKARLEASVQAQAAAVRDATVNLGNANQRIQALVAENDQIRGRNTELVAANTDLTMRLDEALREGRWLREQHAQLNQEISQLREMVPTAADGPVRRTPPALSGTVRDVREQDGITYAQISLGSADRVTRGMEFYVVDPQATEPFLGTLTVESVDINSAIGRIQGPRVDQVRANQAQVRTQL